MKSFPTDPKLPEKERQILIDLYNTDIEVMVDGRLSVNWAKGGRRQVVADIFKALNQIDHVKKSYKDGSPESESEIEKLEGIKATARTIIDEIKLWKKSSEDDREFISDLIASILEKFARVKLEQKIRVREKARSSLGVRDRRQQVNPGATAAKVVSMFRDLDERIAIIYDKLPLYDQKKALLLVIKARMDHNLWSVTEFLHETMTNRDFWRAEELFKTDFDKMRRNLIPIHKRLGTLWVAPYKDAATNADDLIMEAIKHLSLEKNTMKLSNEEEAVDCSMRRKLCHEKLEEAYNILRSFVPNTKDPAE